MSSLNIKKVLLVLCISFIPFLNIKSYAENFDKMRNKALSIIREGQTNKGLQVLETLASRGDLKSIIIVGSLFLNGKNIKKDYKRAYFWFNKGAEKCNQRSLLILEKYFYKRRGSEFFDPQKVDHMKNVCLKKKQKDLEIVKDKSQKKKIIKKEKPKKISRNNNKINKEVTRSWQNITPKYGKVTSVGSGFAINKDGYFLTNHHVIDKCNSIRIKYNSLYGTAKLINWDKEFDSAILKVNALTPYYAKFDDSEYIAGEKLYAAGFPAKRLFGDQMSFSEGMLTSIDVSSSILSFFKGAMLMSVPIASGNSGGPVMNKYGAIRGMVVGGYEEAWVKEILKKAKDKVNTSNVTFNFMVSGNLLKNWLYDNRIRINIITKSQPKLDSDVIGLMAKKFVSNIECVKNE